jgi:hypothetical protein
MNFGARKMSFWTEQPQVGGMANALMLEYQKSVVGHASNSRPISYIENLRAQRVALHKTVWVSAIRATDLRYSAMRVLE